MATQVLKNAHFTVNSVDQSDHIASISITRTKDTPEDTSMGDDSRSYLADGLKGATISVTFYADYAASQTDASLDTIYDSTSAVTFELRPDAGSVSASNPKFTGSCILTDYTAISGSVGDVASQPANFLVTGDVTRATS